MLLWWSNTTVGRSCPGPSSVDAGVGVSAAVLLDLDAGGREQRPVAVHHKDRMELLGLHLFGDGHQLFHAITVDADLVFFSEDVFDLLLPAQLTRGILR